MWKSNSQCDSVWRWGWEHFQESSKSVEVGVGHFQAQESAIDETTPWRPSHYEQEKKHSPDSKPSMLWSSADMFKKCEAQFISHPVH